MLFLKRLWVTCTTARLSENNLDCCLNNQHFRFDMSKPMGFWETNHSRLKHIQECALHNKFSCQHKLLLNVKLENVVLDELHLMLRVTGK